jgi:hypothetical protein
MAELPTEPGYYFRTAQFQMNSWASLNTGGALKDHVWNGWQRVKTATFRYPLEDDKDYMYIEFLEVPEPEVAEDEEVNPTFDLQRLTSMLEDVAITSASKALHYILKKYGEK